jgi:hypothetical protein
VPSISEGVVEYNRVVLEGYIKSINIALVIELLVSFTYNLFIILKVKYNKLILPFKIGFIIAVYVVLLISNKDINIT